jgi:hypothetical protein
MARVGTRWWPARARRGTPFDDLADPVAARPEGLLPAPPAQEPPVEVEVPDPAARELARRVVGLLDEASRRGVPTGPLREAVTAGASDAGEEELAERLGRLDAFHLARAQDGVAAFAERLAAAADGPIAVVSDPVAGSTWMWWDAREQAAGADTAIGRVSLVEVRGESADADAERLTVLVRAVADPKPDFRKALTSRAVGQALDRVRRDPADAALRAAAVNALSRTPVAGGVDWTVAFTEARPRVLSDDVPALSGTVAVIGSVRIEVGGRSVLRNTVLHTVSPSAAAAMLLVENPGLVNGLVDLAAEPGDRTVGVAWQGALTTAGPPDLAGSAVARQAGTVHRPPEVGTTLRITAGPAGRRERLARKTQRPAGPWA